MTVRSASGHPADPIDPATFAAQVQDALARLYDPVHLQTHALARFVRPAPGERTEAIGRRLEEAITRGVDDLATRPGPAAAGRGQTLRALVDWSHDLLTEPERAVLRRLAVFAGGFELEAAEAVGAVDDGGIDRTDVLELLLQLVDKSLVVAEVRGEVERYRLLETIRQHGEEKLVEADEAETVRDGHLRCAPTEHVRRGGRRRRRRGRPAPAPPPPDRAAGRRRRRCRHPAARPDPGAQHPPVRGAAVLVGRRLFWGALFLRRRADGLDADVDDPQRGRHRRRRTGRARRPMPGRTEGRALEPATAGDRPAAGRGVGMIGLRCPPRRTAGPEVV